MSETATAAPGNYFIGQERANGPVNTVSLLGWDAAAERYFARLDAGGAWWRQIAQILTT